MKKQMHNKNFGSKNFKILQEFSPLNNMICIPDLLNFTNPSVTGFYEFMSLDARHNAKHLSWVFPFINLILI